MSLESATYVSELSASNPAASDVRAQGDDHLRLIKSTLQATFPNASKAFRLPTTTSLQTATVNVAASDDGKTIPMNAEAAARTVNLPAGSGVPDGFRVSIVKADHSNNTVTIDGNGTETINGALTITLWQRYQRAVVEWSSSLSAWLAHVEYIPAIGEVTPWTGASACPAGWLFPNGTTIGDASSGAAQRADADCRGLFYHCWAEFSNTVCAVSGGRGASATADFDAHKTLALPNLAGNTWIGLDTLGGISDAGRLTASANGANTAGEVSPLKAAELAAANELKIYTIGVGADEMIVRSFFGSRKVNPSTDLDENTLVKIAESTGGRYFRARNAEELNNIYMLLDQLEPIEKDKQFFRPRTDLFYWPLGLALALSGLIGFYKTKWS